AWQGQAGPQREGLAASRMKSAIGLGGGTVKAVSVRWAAGPPGPRDDTCGPRLPLMGQHPGSPVLSAASPRRRHPALPRRPRGRRRR
ncbi:hypothetical protein Q6273_28310, partial [Klebsiella pneumoniae]